MSSTMNSLSTERGPARTTSPMRAMWGRLLWKDAREIVPIWITLLLSAILCLSVSLWMVNSDIAHIAPLYISGHTFIALISVITGVFLLASEDENRTLHLLRNLPLPPKQIVWQKLALGSVGVIVMACLIAGVTMLLATCAQSKSLDAGSSYRFTLANVVLLPLLYLVIASLCSMISRSHFYGVLIAGSVSVGAIALLEPSWLGAREPDLMGRGEIRWLWVAITVMTGVCALVFGATGWVEERVISTKPLTSRPTELTQTGTRSEGVTRNPFPALLWQSYRQSRTVLLCCIGLTIVGWIVISTWVDYTTLHNHTHRNWDQALREAGILRTIFTLSWSLAMMVLFASSIFVDDKRQGNFLFFQQNRERSRWFWLSRLLPFWALALLLTLAWNFFVFDLGSGFIDLPKSHWHLDPRHIEVRSSIGMQAASQSFLVPLLGLLGIIGIGQYFSMFVRNPILSFVFTGVVSVIFAGLVAYVVFVNESVWLFIVPTVAAGYLATWWRSKSWLATSPRASQYLMPILLPVIVFTIVAAAFINTRATEFGNAQLDASNFANWHHGALLDVGNQRSPNLGLQRVEFGTEAQRQQAAKMYREAIALYQGDHSLMDGTDNMPWPAKKTADFVSEHKVAIAKIIEASLLPVCDPFLSDAPEIRGSERWALEKMALINSHHQLLKSNLPAAKRSIDAYDRVSQRTNLGISTTRYDSGYYGLLIAWADHPDQKLDAIKTAIALLEGSNSDIRPTKIVNGLRKVVEPDSATGLNASRFYRDFGGERAFMNLQYEISSLQNDDLNHRIAGTKHNYRLLPWEYQRQLKVSQLRAIRKFELDMAIINLYSMGNDLSFNYETIARLFTKMRHSSLIPIDEDRIEFTRMYSSTLGILDEAHWRRYTLIRMGLAAYKIEHEQYPDDLLQLEDYYEHELPTTTDGRMFGWFKDGLHADLVEVTYANVSAGYGNVRASEIQQPATKIADKGQPLLLPFYIEPVLEWPEPIEYEKGKLGIDLDQLQDGRRAHVSRYGHFTYYRTRWNVGAK